MSGALPERRKVVNVTDDLPLANKTYTEYTKHVDAGLSGKTQCCQMREHDHPNKRGNYDSALFMGRSSYAAAGVIVLDSNGGGKTNTTGMLTQDVTL